MPVATQVKRRRGTAEENNAFTGAEGEITVDLTNKTLRVHDGETLGGTAVETQRNKTTTITAESTDAQYPSAKAVVDYVSTNSGAHRIIEFQAPTSANGYTWYRKYSDGWVEQGGQVNVNPQTSVTLPVPMASGIYHFNLSVNGLEDDVNVSSKVISNSTNSTTITIRGTYNNGLPANTNICWEVDGMAA